MTLDQPADGLPEKSVVDGSEPPDEEDVLVTFMLGSPGLIDDLLDQHVPDEPRGSTGNRHCRACPSACTGRPVWPCDMYLIARRADGVRARRTTASRRGA